LIAIEKQQPKVIIIVLRVKDKYQVCEDKKLKRYIGKKMAGDIK